jgi:hypothetical protein
MLLIRIEVQVFYQKTIYILFFVFIKLFLCFNLKGTKIGLVHTQTVRSKQHHADSRARCKQLLAYYKVKILYCLRVLNILGPGYKSVGELSSHLVEAEAGRSGECGRRSASSPNSVRAAHRSREGQVSRVLVRHAQVLDPQRLPHSKVSLFSVWFM